MYDTHAHIIGPAPHDVDWPHTTPMAHLDDYIAALDKNNVAKGVLVQPRAHGFDNGLILSAIACYPDRLRGVAVVPANADVAMLRDLHTAGIRGVRLGGKVPVTAMPQIAPYLARAGLHLQLLMRDDDLLRNQDAIAVCPVPVVVDHLAHPDPQRGVSSAHVEALDRLLGLGHVVAKLSAVYRWARRDDYADSREIVSYLVERHPQRLIWGSDWPFVNQASPGPSYTQLLAFLKDVVPDAARSSILDHVPKVLYGF